MAIQLSTHPGIIITNYTYSIFSIYHEIGSKKLNATILIKATNINIMHECTPFDLPNGIPSNLELVAMVEKYIKTIEKK